MLELFTRHGAFDLDLKCDGDLDVDQHHTVEDVGIALGEAFDRALGDKRGILRAGYFVMPMDETLAIAAVDLSGRAAFAVDTKVRTRLVGDLQTELVTDFFEGFARGARANVHVKTMYGRSNHHKIEAIFKAFARALRVACSRDKQLGEMLPIDKGAAVTVANWLTVFLYRATISSSLLIPHIHIMAVSFSGMFSSPNARLEMPIVGALAAMRLQMFMRVHRHRLQSRQSDLGAQDAAASGRGDRRHRRRFVAGRIGGAHRAARRGSLCGDGAARCDGPDGRDSRGHCARRAVSGHLRGHAVALCGIDRSARAAGARTLSGIVHALCRKHGKSAARRLEFARSAQ